MNALEHQLQYPFGETMPEPGKRQEVAPGVYWLRMPLPFALDHINLWLVRDRIEGRDGWTIIDCGITNDTIKTHWETIFANELEGLPVLRVLVTHCHPDHVGLAHWICGQWDVRLWMSLGDYMTARVMAGGSGVGSNAGGDFAASHFARHGLTDEDHLEKLRARKAYYPSMVPDVPTQYRRLMDGDTVEMGADPATSSWRVITGYGHAPEHVALYNAATNVLISGDMVLPRISTNVSVFDMEPEANPLQLYLDSLGKYDDLPADVLVLPSHGRPFRNIHTRIRQLHEHHVDRLAETLDACAEKPCHAVDIVSVIFRRQFDIHQLTFAIGESLAHLHALWHRGELVRHTGEDGIIRFTKA
ncbi:MBL fold metallo-hydrolase [Cupriavidus sp. SW-Y-13]|uniref:MBL fold metallo-hydrolase n=1 Tax=Cupriavidus sp. SW-Y-13 TaxID=2653854 RepID=UPI0013657406|nr:MBL fold metallo-hydrolase [Cupriavidus sp. SW-Y-13]MWL85929.1 MBL fold metallo-hydrolase [Cupriavidus sp. SW-Y-13]